MTYWEGSNHGDRPGINAQYSPMNASFWTNTVWYVALGAVSVALFVLTLAKTRERKKTFAFFFAVLGMTYFIEVFLLIITNAYAYYPKIASDSFHESLIGNFFSQYSVSASAVLIATLGLNIWWRIGFSFAYFLIDVLFVRLNIYAHNWYSSWFTLAGFFVYSWAVGKWHEKVFAHPSKIIYFSTLFLGLFALGGNILGTTLNFLEIRRYGIGLYEQATKDNTATSILYGVLIGFIVIPLYRMKSHPVLKGLIFLALFAFDYSLYRVGVIQVRAGWFVAGSLLTLFGRYFFTGVIDRSLGASDASRT